MHSRNRGRGYHFPVRKFHRLATKRESAVLMFHWTIENFRYCPQKKSEAVSSPTFRFGESDWLLQLYPRGKDDQDGMISCLLTRQCNGTHLCTVEHCVSFRKSENFGSRPLPRPRMKEETFKLNECTKFPYVKAREEVLETFSASFLPGGILTVLCCMRSSTVELTESKQIFGSTHIKVDRRSFLWNIRSFQDEEKVTISIPSVLVDSPSFTFSMCKTDQQDTSKESAHFELLQTGGKPNFTEFRVQLEERDANFEYEMIDILQANHFFEPDGNDFTQCKCSHSISRNNSTPPLEDTFWESDSLALQCEFVISLGESCDAMSPTSQTSQITPVAKTDVDCNPLPRERVRGHSFKPPLTRSLEMEREVTDHLKSDLQRLYAEKLFCDFKIVAGTETFPVHRSILSARSQVFCAMFNTEMVEKSTDFVVVSDIDEDTMNRMLLFMYTGTMEELELGSALKLYFAADKYQLLSLKIECSSFFKSNLTVSNSCDVLVLADMHQDGELVAAVKDFIFKHDKEVVFSPEWTEFKEQHSKLACDIVVEMYKKKLHNEN